LIGVKVHEYKENYKVVLIGESNSGKTSMLLRFSDNIFPENYSCTIAIDFKTKYLKVDKKLIRM